MRPRHKKRIADKNMLAVSDWYLPVTDKRSPANIDLSFITKELRESYAEMHAMLTGDSEMLSSKQILQKQNAEKLKEEIAQLPNPNAGHYNRLLRVYGAQGKMKQALELVSKLEMQEEASGFLLDGGKHAALSDLGNTRDAPSPANERSSGSDALTTGRSNGGALLDERSYTALITACAEAGDAERALQVLGMMEQRGKIPDAHAFTAAMHACARNKATGKGRKGGGRAQLQPRPDLGIQLFAMMRERGISPDVPSYTALLCAYSAKGDFKRSWETYQSIQRAGLEPDVVATTAMIHACARAGSGEVERAFSLLEDMRTVGQKPTRLTYHALIRCCAARAEWCVSSHPFPPLTLPLTPPLTSSSHPSSQVVAFVGSTSEDAR
jgi:pentatricopeptide repeat protein